MRSHSREVVPVGSLASGALARVNIDFNGRLRKLLAHFTVRVSTYTHTVSLPHALSHTRTHTHTHTNGMMGWLCVSLRGALAYFRT